MGRGASKRKLQNLGDGGYFWRLDGGWSKIQAKKGKLVINIFAPNETTAIRFAKYVFEQIP
jgi:hypothetical protein